MGKPRYSIVPAQAVEDQRLTDGEFRTLAAIGRHTDDRGWCWPSQSTLAKIRGISRQTINSHIQHLKELGYLNVEARYREDGGQSSNRMQVRLDWPAPRIKKKGVSGGSDRGVSSGRQGVSSPDLTGGVKPGVDTMNDPNETAQGNDPPEPEAQAGESDHQRLMRLYQQALGYKIPHGAKEAAAAKKILKTYTVEDAIGCYVFTKSDPFWGAKHLSLHTVLSNIGPWIQAGRPKTKAPHHKGQNGAAPTANMTVTEADALNEKRLANKLH